MNILDYGVVTSVLLASMYASHTLIAYPIVIRYGINRQRAVGIAVGGTAVTDTLTLLVLAVISGLYKGETSDYFWIWLVLKFLVLSIIIMYTFPRIARWFFRRYSDNVVQYIFVLAMVFLGGGLMELIGMEVVAEPPDTSRVSADESLGICRQRFVYPLFLDRGWYVD